VKALGGGGGGRGGILVFRWAKSFWINTQKEPPHGTLSPHKPLPPKEKKKRRRIKLKGE